MFSVRNFNNRKQIILLDKFSISVSSVSYPDSLDPNADMDPDPASQVNLDPDPGF